MNNIFNIEREFCSIIKNFSNLIYAYVIFNNFKLSPDFDWSIATDGAHPFSGRAQQDYCDKEKRLEVIAA